MTPFLDFDGVLHPNGPLAQPFEAVPRPRGWLAQWPAVDLVVSSGWRQALPQSALASFLGPVVGARVVGSTPTFDAGWQAEGCPGGAPESDFERQAEYERWMALSWQPDRPCVALDDQGALFEPGLERLVHCDGSTGLSSESLTELSGFAGRANLVPVRSASRTPSSSPPPQGLS